MIQIRRPFQKRRGRLFLVRQGDRRKRKPRKVRVKRKAKVLGEGTFGRVSVRNPWVVRKQFKYPVIRRVLVKRESAIQKRAHRAGLAPRVVGVGKTHMDMRFVRGQPIESHLLTVSDRRQVKLGRKVGRKLKRLHDTGISHRDLHMKNILVSPRGRVTVIDYGLARDYQRPLKMHERRKDYRKLMHKARGRKYEPFREGFEQTYVP